MVTVKNNVVLDVSELVTLFNDVTNKSDFVKTRADEVQINSNNVSTLTNEVSLKASEVALNASLAEEAANKVSTTILIDLFSGTGDIKDFTLSSSPISKEHTLVSINGVIQNSNEYSLSSNVLTFNTHPPLGTDNIQVILFRTMTLSTIQAELDLRAVSFNSRADFIAANIPDAHNFAWIGDLCFERDASGTAITSNGGAVNWSPYGDVNVAHFAENTVPQTTDMTTAIKNAVAFVFANGGGNVWIDNICAISSTITIPQKVFLRGHGGWFKNQYSDTDFKVGGSGLKLLTGSNTDMLDFKYSVGSGEVISDYRLFSGVTDMILFGNRSDSQSPAVVDNNTSGRGIVISGGRYITVNNVTAIKCAEQGIAPISYDYGTGLLSSNNIDITSSQFLSNGGAGGALSGGDSKCTNNHFGYNGGTGATLTGWGIFSENLVWNNFGAGIYLSGSTTGGPVVSGNRVYDNKGSGISLGASTSVANITGNQCLRNGVGATGGAAKTSGIFVNSTELSGIVLSGNDASNDHGTTQAYGIYFNSAVTKIEGFAGNTASNNTIADITLAGSDNVRLHENIGTLTPYHPGFKLDGDLDLNGQSMLGFLLRDYADDGTNGVVISTTPVGLFNGGVDGAIYAVFINHAGGNAGAWAMIKGEVGGPEIITQASVGSPMYTFSISVESVQVSVASSALTSNWKMYRVL
jgi:hypothetical protein